MESNLLAKRIREIMRKKNMTQQQLSTLLGISQPAVSLYLQGRMPPADILYQIAQLDNTSVEWLLTGQGMDASLVKEKTTVYGDQYVLLKLWDRLPALIQKDILNLMRHILEM
jgi:transcriptional regulator with XRE-family HTH domain